MQRLLPNGCSSGMYNGDGYQPDFLLNGKLGVKGKPKRSIPPSSRQLQYQTAGMAFTYRFVAVAA
jgi:hypothetical protein